MWRPACLRFGMLVSIAVIACGGKAATTNDTTLSNRDAPLTASVQDITASYWCSIRSGEHDYPPMPCVVRREHGRYMLAKLAGSQRFRGVIQPRGDGFTFDGEFYCPWGDCTQPLHGVFARQQDGTLRGTFDDKSIVVTMTRAADPNTFAGAGYGGDTYGGSGYGGARYGGQQLAAPQPPQF